MRAMKAAFCCLQRHKCLQKCAFVHASANCGLLRAPETYLALPARPKAAFILLHTHVGTVDRIIWLRSSS